MSIKIHTEMEKEKIHRAGLLENRDISILVVDDDKEDVLFLNELIEDAFKEGSRISIQNVANFDDAMSNIVSKDFDLVILDYQLGYLNGLDIQAAINHEKPKLPVVFITGQGSEKIAVEAMKAGAIDYLVKDGLNSQILVDVLDKVFATKDSAIAKHMKQFFTKAAVNHTNTKFFKNLDDVIKTNTPFKGKFVGSVAKQVGNDFFVYFDRLICV